MTKQRGPTMQPLDKSDPFAAALTSVVVEKGCAIGVKLIAQRFADAGIRLSKNERAAFARSLKGEGPSPTITRRRPRGTVPPTIVVTPDDNRAYSKELRHLAKSAAAKLPKLTDDAAGRLLKSAKEDWVRDEKQERTHNRTFQQRLMERWGRPLSGLNLLMMMARELGERIAAATRVPETPTPHLVDALTRLHARACQVCFEVHTLLSGGLADGALARSRTLHEIAATAFFIQEHGEETAERYLLHEAIESWRAAKTYNKHARRLKTLPYKDSELQRFDSLRDELLERFGPSFDGHYGWASHIQSADGKPIRSFTDLEEAVLPHLRPYYQFASHNVHAKAKGIYHRLGVLGDHEILLAGPSNAGLADPGQHAALSLAQVCSTVALLHATFETITLSKTICRLEREVADDFVRAHRQLVKDDAANHSRHKRTTN